MNSSLCRNCESPLSGAYCHQCGQSTRGSDRFFLTLVNEAFEDIFSLNSRVWQTLSNLLFRPGYLSQEYFAGRRVRYIPPVRLYFTASILFFLVYSVVTFITGDTLKVESTANGSQKVVIDKQSTIDPELSSSETTDQPSPAVNGKENDPNASTLDTDKVDTDGKEDINITLTDGTIKLPGLTQEEVEKLETRLEAQFTKARDLYELNPDFIGDYIREVAPPIIFCLLPLFALLLKIFYVFKGMYYTQHLVLAVHNHCFVFFWLTLHTVLAALTANLGWVNSLFEVVFLLWLPFYLWRSLRVVYRQGVFMTTLKFLILGISYSFFVSFAALGAILFGVLTL